MRMPCFGCEKTGCGLYHDECEEYQKYKMERKRINELRSERVDQSSLQRIQKRRKHCARTPENSPIKCHKK